MTRQKHVKRSLSTVLSAALASVFPHARTSLYQSSPGLPVTDLPTPDVQMTGHGPRRAKIIPFPGPLESFCSTARRHHPHPFVLPRKPLPTPKVPNFATALSPQVGLR